MCIEDIVDNVAKVVVCVGGLITAYKIIYELKESRNQRRKELRWKQSNSARELINDMLSSRFASDACTMFDYSGREFQTSANTIEAIFHKDVRNALRIINLNFSDKEVYIRDCVDAFLFHLELIEQAIQNDLIEFRDVKFPFQYYAKTLKKRDLKGAIDAFIDEYGYVNAKSFLLRFENH